MSYMSDKDLAIREDMEDVDPYSYFEEGEHGFISSSVNPYEVGSFAYSEWDRGYMSMAKRESRDER